MAKQRYINTRFWRDTYIEDLDPTEKLLFLYLLTNPDTNICGIYEIPLKIIAVDTGIDKAMVLKLFKRFEDDNKIKYSNGWVCLKNFTLHQTISPKIKIGIETELLRPPAEIVKWANINPKIEYAYPMQEVSHSNTNTNLNPNPNTPRPESPKPSQSAKADNVNPFALKNKALKHKYIETKHESIFLAYVSNTDFVNFYNLKTMAGKFVQLYKDFPDNYKESCNKTTSRPFTDFVLYHYLRYRKWHVSNDQFKYVDEWEKVWEKDINRGYANNGKWRIYDLNDVSSSEEIETVSWNEWNNLMLERNTRSK